MSLFGTFVIIVCSVLNNRVAGYRSAYPQYSYITIDSLMDLINGTSTVYVPNRNRVPTIEALQSTEELISRAGYPVQVHHIFTEDGQMLTLHRIPGPSWNKINNKYTAKQPILIMHGFIGSSQTWLQIPNGKSLPYVLADQGFDVWLGNFRTNYYSRSHIKYSTRDKRFWDVSFHEMGNYDLPAKIDYILKRTGYSQVIYIGHSMGTSTFLVMTSTRPEYNSKILSAFLLSPIALTIKSQELPSSLANVIVSNADIVYNSLNKLRIYEIFPKNENLYKILEGTCSPGPLQSLCLELIAQGYGEHRENFDLKRLGKLIPGLFAGTTIKTAHHLSQLFNTGEFRMYDNGVKENLYRYGKSTPPDYPLNKVTAPIYMYYGLGDVLMNKNAVNRLAKRLPNVIQINPVKDPKFTHLDFLYGLNTKKVLYDVICKEIQSIVKFNYNTNVIQRQFNTFHDF